MKFHNKVVWITGASSGIGEALAYAFAAEGALLVLSARREEELQRVAKACGNAYVLPFDMLSVAEHADRVQDVINTYGRIDYLVLNAGVSQRSFVKDTTFDVYRRLFEVNFFSIVSLTQAVLPIFSAQKSGVFVPIASVAGRISTPRRAAYGATKHALIGFFDSVRAEVFNDGIRVTTILPGYIKTNISLHAMNEKGEAYGKMDPNQAKGLDPSITAQKILQAVLAEKNEFFVGGFLEGFGLFVKRFFPSIMPLMLRKIKNT
ncbi:SDR family oxidoreductase [Aquirufa novilacunae]|jgi:short-subunit dehydrogenase|uniref:SDR family oxidoreductase n=1 Tax=Aquirufa novilacunae TaxID=3139305 RepID=A0ABW8U681_9BACT